MFADILVADFPGSFNQDAEIIDVWIQEVRIQLQL